MTRSQLVKQYVDANDINNVRLYLLLVKTSPQEFLELSNELRSQKITFSTTKSSKVPKDPDVKPEQHYSGPYHNLYLNTPNSVTLVATDGKEPWFAERGFTFI